MAITFPAPTSDWGTIVSFGLFHADESERKQLRRRRYRRMFARRYAKLHPGRPLQFHTLPFWADVPRDTPNRSSQTQQVTT